MLIVSVVMPVYNQEKYVSAAVESILNQTFTDFELIVVDDGSTDGTGKILEQVTDARVRVVRGSHAGFLVALERAVRESRGRWVARMDSDDICHPQRLQRQLEFLQAHPECLFVGAAYGLVTPNERYLDTRIPFRWRYVEAEQITLGGRVFADPSVMFCKQTAFEVGLYDPAFENENPLWYKLLKVGKGAVLGETLYYARWLLGSHSRCSDLQRSDAARDVHVEIRKKYDPENAARLRQKPPIGQKMARLKAVARSINYYLLARDKRAARTLAWQAWKQSPADLYSNRLLIQSLLSIRAFRFWRKHKPAEYIPIEAPW